jgi:hypothetical protein
MRVFNARRLPYQGEFRAPVIGRYVGGLGVPGEPSSDTSVMLSMIIAGGALIYLLSVIRDRDR